MEKFYRQLLGPESKLTYQQKTILLIFLSFFLRCILAFVLELSNDEAYYWTYSKFLKWNYFDHPPLIAYSIRFWTANLWLQSYEGFLRLGSVVGCALSSWFIFKTTATLFSDRAGWLACCLYNASFYAGIMAGLHAMPDAPQMVFWTFSMWMLARICINGRKWLPWILFGIGAGLCIMSKLHGVFLWFGLGIFILFRKRSWLIKPQFYCSLLISLLVASPILIWNIQNSFATFFFHGNRITINQFTLNGKAFLEELSGQLLYNNPFHVAIIVSALISMRKYKPLQTDALVIYNYIGLPLAILLLAIALFRDTLPHWNGPAYISLLPLAGIYLTEKKIGSIYYTLLHWGIAAFVAFMVAWPLVNNFYPGTYGEKKGIELGKRDVTLDKFGWREGGKQFVRFYQYEIDKGLVPLDAPLVCYKWWGAHIEYYFCRPLNLQMIGLGGMNTLHEYLWTNREKINDVNMSVAYCIVPSDEFYNLQEHYSGFYSKIDSVTTIKIVRNNLPAHNFYIYRLSGWKGKIPVIR